MGVMGEEAALVSFCFYQPPVAAATDAAV